MIPAITPYMTQSPTLSLHEIADRLWATGDHEAYRSLKAYITERDALLHELSQPTKEKQP